MDLLSRKFFGFAVAAMVGTGVLAALPSGAMAGFVQDQVLGLTNPDTLIDFGNDNSLDGDIITNQFSSSGVVFGGTNFRYAIDSTANPGPTLTLGHLGPDNTTIQPGSIFFTSDVTDAVFSLRTNTGTTTFSAFLDGSQVTGGLFSAPTNADNPPAGPGASGNYYGFTGLLFDELRFNIAAANTGFSLDNLQFILEEL